MLMVTTTVRLSYVSHMTFKIINSAKVSEVTYMVHRVHGHTTSLGPRVALDLELVHCAGGLCHQISPIPKPAKEQHHPLSNGLSVLPPPATIPIMPRAEERTTFLAPLGSLTRVLFSSGLWPMTVT